MANRPEGRVREVFTDRFLPEIETLGHDRFTRAEPTLRGHAHDGWEVCYIVDGTVDWWSPDGMHQVRRGDVYLTRPREKHGGIDAMMHPCELYWLILPIPRNQPIAGMTAEQSRELCDGLHGIHLRAFPGSPVVHECFARMMDEHKTRGPLSQTAARASLQLLLVAILRDHARESAARAAQSGTLSKPIRAALRRIDADVADNWLVEQLAADVNLGVSHFHDLFIRQVGLSPAEYRTRGRVLAAKRSLRETNKGITNIAFELGFATSQYFATVFRKHTGMAPRTYRQRAAH